jgi:putative FmdB family regulatory protein
MPLYEYECTQCGKHTEKIQKFSDAEITACPHCGGKLERVITAPSVQFKGGGWFSDGYASAKPSADGGSAKTDSSSAGSEPSTTPAAVSSESKSESKSAAPAPAAPTAAPATSSGKK